MAGSRTAVVPVTAPAHKAAITDDDLRCLLICLTNGMHLARDFDLNKKPVSFQSQVAACLSARWRSTP